MSMVLQGIDLSSSCTVQTILVKSSQNIFGCKIEEGKNIINLKYNHHATTKEKGKYKTVSNFSPIQKYTSISLLLKRKQINMKVITDQKRRGDPGEFIKLNWI